MSADPWALDLPAEITGSQVYAYGGALKIPGLFATDVLAAIEAEAHRQRPLGRRNFLAVSDASEGRGGNPDRAFKNVHGGPVHWECFSARGLVDSLVQMCGLALSPTGGGTYTYYEQEGDFLGLHRDVATCDLTVITCLRETGGDGMLLVYPNHIHESLSMTRACGRVAAAEVSIKRGDSVALLGGIVPHEVTPMHPDQERIVAVMCYRIAALNGAI